MLFSTQATFFATMLAFVSLGHCIPAPVRNSGTTATVNGNTFTDSRNGASVACQRGFTAWCECGQRRRDDNDEFADGVGIGAWGEPRLINRRC